VDRPPLPANEGSRVSALHGLSILDTPPEESFDRLTRLAARVCGTPISLVSLVDEDRQWFKAAQGFCGFRETDRNVAFCGHAILDDDLLVVEDARADPRFAENPLVTGDPNIRFYAGAPLILADGHRVGAICVIDREPGTLDADQRACLRDLADTAVQMMEDRRRLREMVNDLVTAMTNAETAATARTQFLGAMSHELRTPLNAILGFADILKQEFYGELSSRYREAAGLIHASGSHLLNLVNDLLDLGRFQSQGTPTDRMRVDLHRAAEQVVRVLNPIAEAGSVRIVNQVPQGAAIVSNERAVRRIITSLLDNAIRFSPRDSVVSVDFEERPGEVAVIVSDHGAGLSELQLRRARMPFEDCPQVVDDKLPGTGLSLPIASCLAGLLDGNLEIDSRDGEGTHITLTLPVDPDPAQAADGRVQRLQVRA